MYIERIFWNENGMDDVREGLHVPCDDIIREGGGMFWNLGQGIGFS